MIKKSIPVSILYRIREASLVTGSTEALITLTPTKIKFRMVGESGNLCWMDLQYKFQNKVDINNSLTIAIKVKYIKKICRLIPSDVSSAELYMNGSENKLQLNVDNIRLYKPGISTDNISRTENESKYEELGQVVMNGSALNLAFKATSLIDGHVSIKINPKKHIFLVHAEGDLDRMEFKCDKSTICGMNFKNNSDAINLTLIDDYFEYLQPTIPDTTQMTIRFVDPAPIKISYRLPTSRASIVYCLPVKV
jgi:hypothetical protein